MKWSALGLALDMIRGHPRRTVWILIWSLIAAFCEMLAVASVLPLLALMDSQSGSAGGAVGRAVADAFAWLDVEPSLQLLLSVIVIVSLLRAGFQILAARAIGFTASDVAMEQRRDLVDAIAKARWSYFLEQRIGNISAAIIVEAQRVSDIYMTGCRMLANALQLVAYFGFALLISWQATIGGIVFTVGVIWVLRGFNNRIRRHSVESADRGRAVNRRILAALGDMKTLKAMAAEGHMFDMIHHDVQRMRHNQRQVSWLVEIHRQLFDLARVLVLAAGVYLFVLSAETSLASLIVLLLLFIRITERVRGVQRQYFDLIQREHAAALFNETKLRAIEAQEERGGATPPPLEQGIALQEVSFSYETLPVIVRASVDIPARRLIAVTGPSGAGKTTFADLLTGLHNPDSGRILVDGEDLASFDLGKWREQIGYVAQETYLMRDTVRQNVTLGDARADAEVVAALEGAGAWSFVSALPDGLDAVIGESGIRLSGGQRQRLSIARALIRRPRLLILDEATSALDPATEAAIWSTVRNLSADMTVIAISHQRAIVNTADLIIRIDNGTVTSVGQDQASGQQMSGSRSA